MSPRPERPDADVVPERANAAGTEDSFDPLERSFFDAEVAPPEGEEFYEEEERAGARLARRITAPMSRVTDSLAGRDIGARVSRSWRSLFDRRRMPWTVAAAGLVFAAGIAVWGFSSGAPPTAVAASQPAPVAEAPARPRPPSVPRKHAEPRQIAHATTRASAAPAKKKAVRVAKAKRASARHGRSR